MGAVRAAPISPELSEDRTLIVWGTAQTLRRFEDVGPRPAFARRRGGARLGYSLAETAHVYPVELPPSDEQVCIAIVLKIAQVTLSGP